VCAHFDSAPSDRHVFLIMDLSQIKLHLDTRTFSENTLYSIYLPLNHVVLCWSKILDGICMHTNIV